MYSKLLKRVRRHRRISVLFRRPVYSGVEMEQSIVAQSPEFRPAPKAVVVLPSLHGQTMGYTQTPVVNYPNQPIVSESFEGTLDVPPVSQYPQYQAPIPNVAPQYAPPPNVAPQVAPPPNVLPQQTPQNVAPRPVVQNPPPQRQPQPQRQRPPKRQLSRRERQKLEMDALVKALHEEGKKEGIVKGENDSFRTNIKQSPKSSTPKRSPKKRRVVSKEELAKLTPKRPRPERRSGVVYLSEDQKMGLEDINVPAPEKITSSEQSTTNQTDSVVNEPTVENPVEDVAPEPVVDVVEDVTPDTDTTDLTVDEPSILAHEMVQALIGSDPVVDEVDESHKDFKEPVYNPVPLRDRDTDDDKNVHDILKNIASEQETDSKIEIVTPKRPRPNIPRRRPTPKSNEANSSDTLKKTIEPDVTQPVVSQPAVPRVPVQPPVQNSNPVTESIVPEGPLDNFSEPVELSKSVPVIPETTDVVDPSEFVELPQSLPIVPETTDVVDPSESVELPQNLPIIPETLNVESPAPVVDDPMVTPTPVTQPPQQTESSVPPVTAQDIPPVQSSQVDTPSVVPNLIPPVSPPPVTAPVVPPTVSVMPDTLPPVPTIPPIQQPETAVQRKVNQAPNQSQPTEPKTSTPIAPVTPTETKTPVSSDVVEVERTETAVPDQTTREVERPQQVENITPQPEVDEPTSIVPSSFASPVVESQERETIPEPPIVENSPIRPDMSQVEIEPESQPKLDQPIVAKASLATPRPQNVSEPVPKSPVFDSVPNEPVEFIPEIGDPTVVPMVPPVENESIATQPQVDTLEINSQEENLIVEPVGQQPIQPPELPVPLMGNEFVTPVEYVEQNPDLFDDVDTGIQVQNRPLEDILDVERVPHFEKPDLIRGEKDFEEPTYNPVPLRDRNTADDENVRDILQHIDSGQDSSSQIEVVTPKRPRPKMVRPTPKPQPNLPETNKNTPQVTPQLPQQNEVVSPVSSNPVLPSESPELIETDIGPLPSDLWDLIGETPPPQVSSPEPPQIVPQNIERPTQQSAQSIVPPPLVPTPVPPQAPQQREEPRPFESPLASSQIPQQREEPRPFETPSVPEVNAPVHSQQSLPPVLPRSIEAPRDTSVPPRLVDGSISTPQFEQTEGLTTPKSPTTADSGPQLIPTEIGPLPSDLWSAIGETPPVVPPSTPKLAPEPIVNAKPDVPSLPPIMPLAPEPIVSAKPDLPPLSQPASPPQPLITAVAAPTTNWQSFNQPLVVSTPEPVYSPTVISTPSETLVVQRTPVDAIPSTRTPIDFAPEPSRTLAPENTGNTATKSSGNTVVQRKVDNKPKPAKVNHVMPPRTIQRETAMDTKKEMINEAQDSQQDVAMPPPIDVDELARQVYSELKRRMARDWERGRQRYS